MGAADPGVSAPRRVVIVGGGAAGTLVALHLAVRGAGRPGSAIGEVVVVEPAERLGEGIAYGTRSPSHLLNVRADGMSAFPDRPTHFTDWARGTGLGVTGAEFLPRMLYAPYLRGSLADAVADGRPAVGHLRDRAIGLRVASPEPQVAKPGQPAPMWVRLSDGAEVPADEVVLATGNALAPLSWLAPSPRVIRDPWAPGALAEIAADASVAIVGTGLSAVDVVLSLRDRGHAGEVTMVSSHGLLPEPHVPGVLPWRGPALEPAGPMRARDIVRALRADAAVADDWRQTIDGARAVTVDAWRALPLDERRRALRHGFRRWEVRRHRMAPEVAAVVGQQRAAGRLHVMRGRVRSVEDVGGPVVLLVGAGGSQRVVSVDVVIACVGPSADPLHDPLVAGLLADGVVARHPLGLGLDVDGLGRALRHDETVQRHLWTVGSLRRGAEWESTAVPELRLHAAAIARALIPDA